MNQLAKMVLGGIGVLLAGWIGWGLFSTSQAKSVPYERRDTLDGIEIREYPQTILAETVAPSQRLAFRRLFRYISGDNQGSESISMTAPVETAQGEAISMTAPVRSGSANGDGDAVKMAFYLPPEYSPETAPEPTASNVSLVTEPSKTVAVDRFSWYAPEWRVERRIRDLRSTLERNGLEQVGDPYLLRYNDPWTPPFMRRNEVAIAVAVDE